MYQMIVLGKIFAQLSSSLGFRLIVVTSKPESYPYSAAYVLDARGDLLSQIQLDVERHILLDGVLTAIELIKDESVALNGKLILTIDTS